MSEHEGRTRSSDVAPNLARIDDPKAGLERMKELLTKILRVPKDPMRPSGSDPPSESEPR